MCGEQQSSAKIKSDLQISRGDILLVNCDPSLGTETKKIHPAVVIQNNIGNKYSPLIIISVIDSEKPETKKYPIFVFLKSGEGGLDKDSYVDCGQIRTFDKEKRVIKKLGSLSNERMSEIDGALKISLGLS